MAADGTITAESLAAHVRAGREAWPDVPLADADFVHHVAALGDANGPLPLEYAADLWIATACALGVTGAASAFERTYRTVIERAIARVDRTVVDDGTQAVLVSLLVRDAESAPRIAAYAGRAALRTWLTTVATRTALNLRRNKDDQPHESVSKLSDAVVAGEPELVFARARYGPELEAALGEALGRLDPRQLVLLRLHHAQGWSIDRLGGLYNVGRSTAARWVAAARDALLEETKKSMHARVRLTASELESLVGLLQSNLDTSLLRLLDEDE